MPASTGAMVRTTSGSATSAWAIGTSSGESRRSRGGSSRAMRKPKPIVTALTPSGSMKRRSNDPRTRRSTRVRDLRVTSSDTARPISSAIHVASTAIRSDVTRASVTGTSRAWSSPVVVRRR